MKNHRSKNKDEIVTTKRMKCLYGLYAFSFLWLSSELMYLIITATPKRTYDFKGTLFETNELWRFIYFSMNPSALLLNGLCAVMLVIYVIQKSMQCFKMKTEQNRSSIANRLSIVVGLSLMCISLYFIYNTLMHSAL